MLPVHWMYRVILKYTGIVKLCGKPQCLDFFPLEPLAGSRVLNTVVCTTCKWVLMAISSKCVPQVPYHIHKLSNNIMLLHHGCIHSGNKQASSDDHESRVAMMQVTWTCTSYIPKKIIVYDQPWGETHQWNYVLEWWMCSIFRFVSKDQCIISCVDGYVLWRCNEVESIHSLVGQNGEDVGGGKA